MILNYLQIFSKFEQGSTMLLWPINIHKYFENLNKAPHTVYNPQIFTNIFSNFQNLSKAPPCCLWPTNIHKYFQNLSKAPPCCSWPTNIHKYFQNLSRAPPCCSWPTNIHKYFLKYFQNLSRALPCCLWPTNILFSKFEWDSPTLFNNQGSAMLLEETDKAEEAHISSVVSGVVQRSTHFMTRWKGKMS